MCAKSSDVSNAAKPWDIHEQWSKRVLYEFYAQGDLEQQRGIAISTLCNRKEVDTFKSQVGFIDFVVMPLAKVWCDFLQSDRVAKDLGMVETGDARRETRVGSISDATTVAAEATGIKANRQRWKALEERGSSQQPYKDSRRLGEVLFERGGKSEVAG